MLLDRFGHVKYMVDKFKPSKSMCVSNYKINKIGLKTLFYNIELDIKEELAEDTCWTPHEVVRRIKESEFNEAKIFTRVQDFYDVANEIQFAYTETLDSWDEQLDIEKLKSFCSNFKRESLGEVNGVKFFRYTKN